MVYIAMDDTDMPDTRGTGHLARKVAASLTATSQIRGVSRHQLLRDPRVPMTKNNSANVVYVVATDLTLAELADAAEQQMRASFVPGSDPGLCVVSNVTPRMTAFGEKAKTTLVSQNEALESTEGSDAIVRGLGGTEGGIIGATAAAALAASGADGRFVSLGTVRNLQGTVGLDEVLSSGVAAVRTVDGQTVTAGAIEGGEKIRPEIIDGQPVVLVTPESGGNWVSVRRE